MRSTRLGMLLITVTAASSLSAAPGADPADSRLTVEHVVGLRRVTDVAIGPAGRRAAYVLSVPRDAGDEPGASRTEIWVADLIDGSVRRFTREGGRASAPRWSPDGRRIAFLSQRDPADEEEEATTQLYAIPVDGGEAAPLVDHETSVDDFRWSPDGRRVAFIARDERPEPEDGRDWTVVGEDRPSSRIWIADVGGGRPWAAHDATLNVTALAWTPDGRSIVARATTVPGTDDEMMRSRLYRVPVPTEDVAERAGVEGAGVGGAGVGGLAVLVRTEGKLGPFAVSPDGAHLAYLGAVSLNDPLAQSVFVTPIDGSEPRNLSGAAERSAASLTWLDERTILEHANDGTRTSLAIVDIASGERRPVVVGGPAVSAVDVHGASGRLVVAAGSPSHPAELFAGSLASGQLELITDHNPDLAALTLGRVETLTWRARDGNTIEGVVVHPVTDRPGPHPLVVNPHGGPEGVSRAEFSELPQLLAARGYLVLQPNYRGSGGRGVAFSKGDHDDLGGGEFDDILAGIDELVRRGLADPDRVGMGGWSYGGYLSAMAATHHSPRFRASVMGAGIANWISFTGTTDIPDEMSIVHWNRPMAENVELYWERSPLAGLDRAATPTLILYGADDERVPPSQGHELHQALRSRGVATEMILYPRAGHGVRERAHRVDLLERQLAWFERYLGDAP